MNQIVHRNQIDSSKILSGEPSLIYKLINIECYTSPGFSANSKCYLKAINWNKAVAQMDVDVTRPLKNISLRFHVSKKDYSNKYQPFLINVVVNICDVFAKRNFIPYGKIFLKLARQFSNFNHSCPYKGHLFARDLFVDTSILPNLLPLGIYKVNITIMEGYMNKPTDYVGGVMVSLQAMTPFKKRGS
ncbi:uncharacterized protein Dana_GF19710 [Drosophila ananassae]|uniref:MD-2-related lipid-recognition domain-containing protein n=1 Tax=Drosophila ananassae TaxID=7217 RepID=B3MKS1_DROAN|nr:uncharacterized protein Dana_GF19710 [Drosophila ananassae]